MQSFKDTEIDKGILPLIKTMNGAGWIETISCCEGHPGAEHFQQPYIAFYCKASKIKTLCSILNATSGAVNSAAFFDLSIVFSNEVNGCQEDAPRGWIALDLQIDTEARAKRKVFNLLSAGLKIHSV